jgi:hypothetical protein
MSSLRCRAGVHDWNKYGPLVDSYGGLTQFRDCKRCGRVDYTKCYGNQAKATVANESVNPEPPSNE